MSAFTVYLTSDGSKPYYPSNNATDFTNKLASPLENVSNYEVGIVSCVLSPNPATPVVVLVDIIKQPLFNEGMSYVIGVYNSRAGVVSGAYAAVSQSSIASIRCWLTDMHRKPIPSYTEALIGLHFRPKRAARDVQHKN